MIARGPSPRPRPRPSPTGVLRRALPLLAALLALGPAAGTAAPPARAKAAAAKAPEAKAPGTKGRPGAGQGKAAKGKGPAVAPKGRGEAGKAAGARGKSGTPATKARRAAPKAPPPEPPPPDPLAGAWPSREDPQVGDGTLPSEILVAARRVLGLKGSFDEDAFLRHLAYVLDLARKSDRPDDAWAETLARRAAARGALRKDAKARPGDLALFSLDARRPRSPQAARVLVAVVESSSKGAVRFIGPVGDEVRRGLARPGAKSPDGDTILRECRAPDPPPPPPSKSKKKGAKKAARPKKGKALPCHAGVLWIGRVPAEALPGLF